MDSSYGSPNAKYIRRSNFGMQIVDQIKTLKEQLRVCGQYPHYRIHERDEHQLIQIP